MAGADELSVVVTRVCDALGVELYDLEPAAGVIKVTVETSGGLDLDALAEVARAISDALDELDEDLVPIGRYELEVSTPGLERRLRRPDHFLSAVGHVVAVRTRPGVPGARRLDGVLLSADADGVVVASGDAERRIAYGEVDRAHTVFDWRSALAASPTDDGSVGTATTRERAATS